MRVALYRAATTPPAYPPIWVNVIFPLTVTFSMVASMATHVSPPTPFIFPSITENSLLKSQSTMFKLRAIAPGFNCPMKPACRYLPLTFRLRMLWPLPSSVPQKPESLGSSLLPSFAAYPSGAISLPPKSISASRLIIIPLVDRPLDTCSASQAHCDGLLRV